MPHSADISKASSHVCPPSLCCSQAANPWCYKTFYLSSQPSWHELQQLRATHAMQLAAHMEMMTQHTEGEQLVRQSSPGQNQAVEVEKQGRQQQEAQGQQQGNLQEEKQWQEKQQQDSSEPQQQPDLQEQQHESTKQQWQQQRNPEAEQQHQRALRQEQQQQLPERRQCHPQQQQQQQGGGDGGGSGLCPRLITVQVSDNIFQGSTGCSQWDAGFICGEFVVQHQHLFKGGFWLVPH